MYWKTKFKHIVKTHMETLKIHMEKAKEFLFFLSRRAQNDTIFRVSASLSYTSLIAIVPLFAIGLSIFSAFPVFEGVKEQVQEFLLKNFVPTIEQEVSQYIAEFISATTQLTTIGVVAIAITSILMLSTIENSLNFIFKVNRPRRLTTKITLYWTVITLGPLLLGTAFSLRGYLYTLQKMMPEDFAGTQAFISGLLPSLITMITLVLVYVLVPNKKIKITNALIGALVAVILFYILRQGFGWFMLKTTTYKTLYGALATIPIFLIWMYLAWAVVIFGAVVTAALEEYQQLDQRNLKKIIITGKPEKRK